MFADVYKGFADQLPQSRGSGVQAASDVTESFRSFGRYLAVVGSRRMRIKMYTEVFI